MDDDPGILRVVRRTLEAAGYDVLVAARASEVLELVRGADPDVVVLDLVLPDGDGISLTRAMRGGRAAIIVLSAVGDDRRKVEALDEGADDYLTKPFSIPELLARIRVALRHQAGAATEPAIVAGPILMDLAARLATINGATIKLTPREWSLLRALMEHPGRVFTQRQLLTAVWGPEFTDDTHILRTFIHQLRGKMDAAASGAGAFIVNEPGVGYRLATSPEP
ncbi:MAG: response regulator transcription factor [Dehalococcoidia bacterium]